MQYQFEKSQYVCYGANGVCRIEDICPMPGMRTQSLFYVLRPIADRNSVYYIPTDNEKLTSKMRLPLTREQIDETIDAGSKTAANAWSSAATHCVRAICAGFCCLSGCCTCTSRS